MENLKFAPMNRLFLLIAVLLITFSCQRKEETKWTTNALFPVAYGSISLESLTEDTLFVADENGILHFSIREDLTDLDIDSLVRIPDTTLAKAFEFPIPGGPFPFAPGTNVIDLQEEVELETEAALLREIIVKSGEAAYVVKNYMNGQLKIEYQLPGVTKGGQQFVIESVVEPGSPDNPFVSSGTLDLSGYHFDLSGSDGIAFNRLASITNVGVDENATADAIIFGNDSVVIEVTFLEPTIEYGRGYFGQHEYNLQDTIQFAELSGLEADNFDIETISFSLDIENYVGADAQIQLSQVGSYNSYGENSVYLEHEEIGDLINLTRAQDNGGVISPTFYSLSMTESNSNIDQFVENLPNELIVDIGINVNPLGDVSAGNDFIYTDQPLKALVEVDVPLCLAVENLTVSDTLAIQVEETPNASGILHFYMTNHLPLEARLTANLVDVDQTVLATILEDEMLLGASQNVDLTTNSVMSELQAEVSSEVMELITQDNFIQIEITLDTYNGEAVKITSDQLIEFRVVADVTGEIGYN